jgi:EAL domain-containing protein (putative c-di-GMP-specific phosphodiesterase class I)
MLKIDKAFVDSLAFNEKQQNFVHLIIKLAHNFGLKVIAEGVETETQVEWLSYCHCDYIQGYIFSRPIPIDEALRLAVCRKVDITKIS